MSSSQGNQIQESLVSDSTKNTDHVLSLVSKSDHHAKALAANIKIQVADIIKSTDKLFFISYQMKNSNRREWKLVQLNLTESMDKNKECFQNL